MNHLISPEKEKGPKQKELEKTSVTGLKLVTKLSERQISIIELANHLNATLPVASQKPMHVSILLALSIVGSIFFSSSLNLENKTLHPIYDQYLSSFNHHATNSASAKIFTPETIRAMNAVAMNREVFEVLKK